MTTPPRLAQATPSNSNIFQYRSTNRMSVSMSFSRHGEDGISAYDQNLMLTPEHTPIARSRRSSSSGSIAEMLHNRPLPPASTSLAAAAGTPAPVTTIDPTHQMYSVSPVSMESQRLLLSPTRGPRGISKIPYKVLDAPDLVDDFYLNLVDWGSQNVLGVGLGSKVYVWNAETSDVKNLCDLGADEMVTSISWIKRGTHLAIGTRSGMVQIWDAAQQKRVRTMSGHDKRAGALAWNDHILSSGSRDRTILHRDVRISDHYIKRLTGHKQEVCGLKWNTEENQLASGGNDNRLVIWDGMNEQQLFRFTDHRAAIKAIAWSPHTRGLLASGGGTADRRIRFWNTLTGACVNEIDTGSQVCNLAWSRVSNELVSTHGYSQNQVVVWKYPTMQQVAVLTGHTYRVLYLAMSPDGRTIATGAGDETLRFWNVFDDARYAKRASTLLDVFPKLR